jgi:hypothetical protein
MIENLNNLLQLIIQSATIVTLIYALTKFLNTSNKVQDERINMLEKWKRDVETRLDKGDMHFRVIDEGNKVTQRAILALIDHGINGNDVDKLKRAKADLEDYLTDR